MNHWITELRFIDSYATSFYREQAVRCLVENGIKVTVFGGGWDRCSWAEHPNFIYGGKILAPQVLELMNHSKIVLNTMTWYKNGIHDRIINGMLAVMQELPEMTSALLQKPEYMEEIAETGYRYAKKHHTFKQRAEYIYQNYLQK